jgi:hypothetical protein
LFLLCCLYRVQYYCNGGRSLECGLNRRSQYGWDEKEVRPRLGWGAEAHMASWAVRAPQPNQLFSSSQFAPPFAFPLRCYATSPYELFLVTHKCKAIMPRVWCVLDVSLIRSPLFTRLRFALVRGYHDDDAVSSSVRFFTTTSGPFWTRTSHKSRVVPPELRRGTHLGS